MLELLTQGERQEDLKYYLSEVKITSYPELQERYGVSKVTLSKDIRFLKETMGVPIETKPGVGGYIMIRGDWTAYMRHFSLLEVRTIIEVLPVTTDEQKQIFLDMIGKFYSRETERILRDQFL
ncbi:HTH domain-containing protein [Ruminococcaceae bacterium YRB3002]|nr:HTH domain-containing protein [Ruminococcaceae bacterium YRB3002]